MTRLSRLGPEHAQAFFDLRLRGLLEHPDAFGQAASDFESDGVSECADRLRHEPGRAWVLGAWDGDALVGLGGLYWRHGWTKVEHKAQIWGMYVRPDHRGQGVGRQVLRGLLQVARDQPTLRCVALQVVAGNDGAQALYESEGFRVWGREPAALRIDGMDVDELHLHLDL
jgi:ribosomal protein S18 acetylase RimI-like enzyme